MLLAIRCHQPSSACSTRICESGSPSTPTPAHHGFLAVHPFLDGNGRTARLLLNLMLLRDGYPPALLLQEWRLGYLDTCVATPEEE
jgi:Fic/DOC family